MRRHQATTAFALPCLCAAILLSAACTTQASYQRQIKHTRELLLQAGDPDSLETAAFLTEFGKDEPAERLEAFARADAAAPDRPDLIWLHLQACGEVPSCTTGPLESRLQALDPENGAAWAMSMKEAVHTKDPTQLRAVTRWGVPSASISIGTRSFFVHRVHLLRPARWIRFTLSFLLTGSARRWRFRPTRPSVKVAKARCSGQRSS